MLRRITDYWDARANAVFTLAQRLEAIERGDRMAVLAEITRCVDRHLDVLSREQLESVAWITADDLYRSACALSYWDVSIPDYLTASARPLLRRLTKYGYSVRYFVDNEFASTRIGLAGPAEWFPLWFAAAGFAYICPQEVAFRRIRDNGHALDSWTDSLSEYLPGARASALDALKRCRGLGTHVVFLDAESREEAAELAFGDPSPGVIVAFRNKAPHESSTCIVKVVQPAN
jgi:hypothetical protein